MPTARVGLAAVAGPDGRIYAIGGSIASSIVSGFVGTVEAYSPGTNTWTTVAQLPTARAHSTAAIGIDGRIYVVGGWNGAALNTVEAYSPNTDTWTTVANMPTARMWLGLASGGDGRLYAMGGQPGQTQGTNSLSDVEVYMP